MVFTATFNNISDISWRSVLLVEETRVSAENHRPTTSHSQTLSNYIWNTQTFINSDWFISLLKQTLKDQYNQLWHPQAKNSAKALTYSLFKDNFMPEPYLDIVDSKNAINLCKFRATNHRSPIELGYVSSVTQIPLEMNFIIFYNVHTLSKTVTLEIGQMFLNLKML